TPLDQGRKCMIEVGVDAGIDDLNILSERPRRGFDLLLLRCQLWTLRVDENADHGRRHQLTHDCVGICLVCGFAFLAVASLLFGGREGHVGHAGMVTLPWSSLAHYAVCSGRRGVDFIEEFSLPCRWIRRILAIPTRLFALVFPGFVAPVAASFDARFCGSGG